MRAAEIDWSHWGDVATALTPFGTLLLFGITIYQARKLRDQVEQGQHAVKEAGRAATAAEGAVTQAARAATATERAVTEAARSRIEATAPHVVAFIQDPLWPPSLDRQRTVDGLGHLKPLDPMNREPLSSDITFFFPENNDIFLWFPLRITLRNEGQTTARVELGGDIDLAVAVSLTPEEVGSQGSFTRIGSWADANTYALPPGQTMYLDWNAGRRLAEWRLAREEPEPPNPYGSVSCTITCRQESADGILDTITFELAGRPLKPDQMQQGKWRLTDDPQHDVVALVSERVRRYRVGGVLDPVGPSLIQQTYADWQRLADKDERTKL